MLCAGADDSAAPAANDQHTASVLRQRRTEAVVLFKEDAMSLVQNEKNGLVYFTSPDIPVPHGFSTRVGGVSKPPYDSLNLGPGRGDDHAAVVENSRRFCDAIGADVEATVLSAQVHETTVRAMTEADRGKGLFRERDYTADALITNVRGLTLAVFSADCGNILLWDEKTGAVGAVHAGWRGCAAGILGKTGRDMERLYGTRSEDLYAAIGPCIGACCFETDEDVPSAMLDALGGDAAPYLSRAGKKWHVDLQGLNELWLLRAGLDGDRIAISGLCTACRPDLFWSHRKMGTARGLQSAVISCT